MARTHWWSARPVSGEALESHTTTIFVRIVSRPFVTAADFSSRQPSVSARILTLKQWCVRRMQRTARIWSYRLVQLFPYTPPLPFHSWRPDVEHPMLLSTADQPIMITSHRFHYVSTANWQRSFRLRSRKRSQRSWKLGARI